MIKRSLFVLGLSVIFISCSSKNSTDSANSDRTSRHSCTAFVLDNNGYAVFGTNYDNKIGEGLLFINKRNVTKSYWEKDPISDPAEWTSKYGSVTFNLVMNQDVWGGMNEAGLVITTLWLDGSQPPEPDERPWLYSGWWRQYLLDNFSTVEEVIASDSLVRIKEFVEHFLVSDRSGNCASIEFIDGKMVYNIGKTMPVNCLTNNTYEESIKSWQNYKLPNLPDAEYKGSLLRFQIAADLVTKYKSTNSEPALSYAFATLKEVEGSITQWSIVFDTENIKIYFRTKTHPEVRYINLQDLDFSCKTPIKMLDVHEKLSGDITHQLTPYSSKLHFNHALHAWNKWGVNINPDTLRKQINYLESYHCQESDQNR
jgi:penicillin V acylase-like amidase (Ntn superfamily)